MLFHTFLSLVVTEIISGVQIKFGLEKFSYWSEVFERLTRARDGTKVLKWPI